MSTASQARSASGPTARTTAPSHPRSGASTVPSTDRDARIFPLKVRAASAALGSQAKLASFVGVSRSQATRWAEGETEPSPGAARAVTDLEFIVARARMVWGEAVLRDWLEGHNAFLDGATPLEMIRAGRTAEVLDAITGDESGVYA